MTKEEQREWRRRQKALSRTMQARAALRRD